MYQFFFYFRKGGQHERSLEQSNAFKMGIIQGLFLLSFVQIGTKDVFTDTNANGIDSCFDKYRKGYQLYSSSRRLVPLLVRDRLDTGISQEKRKEASLILSFHVP